MGLQIQSGTGVHVSGGVPDHTPLLVLLQLVAAELPKVLDFRFKLSHASIAIHLVLQELPLIVELRCLQLAKTISQPLLEHPHVDGVLGADDQVPLSMEEPLAECSDVCLCRRTHLSESISKTVPKAPLVQVMDSEHDAMAVVKVSVEVPHEDFCDFVVVIELYLLGFGLVLGLGVGDLEPLGLGVVNHVPEVVPGHLPQIVVVAVDHEEFLVVVLASRQEYHGVVELEEVPEVVLRDQRYQGDVEQILVQLGNPQRHLALILDLLMQWGVVLALRLRLLAGGHCNLLERSAGRHEQAVPASNVGYSGQVPLEI